MFLGENKLSKPNERWCRILLEKMRNPIPPVTPFFLRQKMFFSDFLKNFRNFFSMKLTVKNFRIFLTANFIEKLFTAEFIEKKIQKFFTVNFIEKKIEIFYSQFYWKKFRKFLLLKIFLLLNSLKKQIENFFTAKFIEKISKIFNSHF